MMEKTKIISSFLPTDFNIYGQAALHNEPTFSSEQHILGQVKREKIDAHIHYLNGLNFLRSIVEVCRRLYRDENGQIYDYEDPKAKQSDKIPIAIFQVRSSTLLQKGLIELNDVFGESTCYGNTIWTNGRPTAGSGLHRAQYGVATGKDTIKHVDKTQAKGVEINKRIEDNTRALINNSEIFSCPVDLKTLIGIKASNNTLREELGREYGGDSESEGSDYSDVESNLSYKCK